MDFPNATSQRAWRNRSSARPNPVGPVMQTLRLFESIFLSVQVVESLRSFRQQPFLSFLVQVLAPTQLLDVFRKLSVPMGVIRGVVKNSVTQHRRRGTDERFVVLGMQKNPIVLEVLAG